MFSRSIASSASVPDRQDHSYLSQVQEEPISQLENFRKRLQNINNSYNLTDLSELWDSFSSVLDSGVPKQINTNEIIRLSWLLLNNKVLLYSPDLSQRRFWSERLQRVHVLLKKRKYHFQPEGEKRLLCIRVAILSLQGRIDKMELLSPTLLTTNSDQATAEWILSAQKHALMSVFRHDTRRRAIEFYYTVKDTFTGIPASQTPKNVVTKNYIGNPFHHELKTIFRSMESPASFLSAMSSYWEKEMLANFGCILLSSLLKTGLLDKALEVLGEFSKREIKVDYNLLHDVIRLSVLHKEYETAERLYYEFPPSDETSDLEAMSYYHAGLYLFAHTGDQRNAEELFRWLDSHGNITSQDVTLVLYASAVKGDTKRAVELYERLFNQERLSEYKVKATHLGAVITSFAIANDLDGMHDWFARVTMSRGHLKLSTCNACISMLVRLDNIVGVRAILDYMRSHGLNPNEYSYTTIIRALARRRDLIGAELLYKQMLDEGIPPNRISLSSLMNAHVESGSWQGVIRIFDYLRSLPKDKIPLSIDVFNTLLKAYVHIGAPLDVLIRHFRKLRTLDIKPNNRTFSLLIQSACDSNRMDVARNLLSRMEVLSEDRHSNIQLTKEALSIMMAAYFRIGDNEHANLIYQFMLERGLQPSAPGLASVVDSYARSSESGTQDAEEYVNALIDGSPEEQRAWSLHTSGKGSAMSFLYTPLIKEHVKRGDVEEAEKIYKQYIERDEQPSIEILTLLLDVYRHVEDIDGVRRVWSVIVERATSRTAEVDDLLDIKDKDDKFFRERRRSSVICVPLTAYIDAMSQAGLHVEIAHTWNDLRSAGFQFDAHNWNHLAVALVRAGQVLRAFEIVEKVILPYQRQAIRLVRQRLKAVTSPLLLLDPEVRKGIEERPVSPFKDTERWRLKKVTYMTNHYMPQEDIGQIKEEVEEVDEDDFAYELQMIQEISPEWNIWRPFTATHRALAYALDELEAGRLVKPVKSPSEGNKPVHLYKHEETEKESQEAQEMLHQILQDYPETVRKVAVWTISSNQGRSHKKTFSPSYTPRGDSRGGLQKIDTGLPQQANKALEGDEEGNTTL